MPSTTLTIDQLCLSPFNVRTRVPSVEDTAAIEASILVEGLRVPIEVHQMRGSKTKWGAFAGRRRYFAIKRLVERGELRADWPVPVVVHDRLSEAELVEHSITENLLRKEMELHELFAGVARAASKGHDVATITRNLGQRDEGEVARWLRLGQLAKPVFEAFVTERIEIEQARAFAATADQELQAAVFAQFVADGRYMTPAAIRQAMNIGDVVQRRHLTFVGEAIYRAAGGRYELDLFAETAQDRGRVADAGVLARLVEEKLAGIREEIRAATGRGNLRFVPKPPQTDYGAADYQLAVTPKRAEAGGLILPGDEIVAHIEIDGHGEPMVTYWWADRKSKFGTEKPRAGRDVTPGSVHTMRAGIAIDDSASPGARRQADAAIKEDVGASQDAIQILRVLRRAILRAILVADADTGGDVSTDYLVWAQLRMTLEMGAADVGMTKLPTETIGANDLAQRARAQLEASGAASPVGEALRELQVQPFATIRDLGAAFLAFREASRRLKELAAAVITGQALVRSLNAPLYTLPIHDTVAHEARGDDAIRAHWTPTAQLLDLFPKAQQLALVEGDVNSATLKRWSGLKAAAARDAVLDHLTRNEDWVHPLLRFEPPPIAPAADLELAEAAE